MKTTPCLDGMFCWHELVTPRSEDGAAFYKELFGGQVQSFPMGNGTYSIIHVEDQAVGGVQPHNSEHAMDAASQWLCYVAVPDVDACCARAVANGGTVQLAPHDNPMGRAAIIRDPQGARLAVFRANPGATDGTNPEGVGAVCWVELLTHDVPAAARFYAAVLGWTVDVKHMPFGDVHVGMAGGAPVCSMCARDPKDTQAYARWYPFFQVDNADHATKRIRALGGRESTVPMTLPSVGRWFPGVDAVGAEVAFMELEKPAHA